MTDATIDGVLVLSCRWLGGRGGRLLGVGLGGRRAAGGLFLGPAHPGDVLDQRVDNEAAIVVVVGVAAQLHDPARLALGRFDCGGFGGEIFPGRAAAVALLLILIHLHGGPEVGHVGRVAAIKAGYVNLGQVHVGLVDVVLAERPLGAVEALLQFLVGALGVRSPVLSFPVGEQHVQVAVILDARQRFADELVQRQPIVALVLTGDEAPD